MQNRLMNVFVIEKTCGSSISGDWTVLYQGSGAFGSSFAWFTAETLPVKSNG